MTGRGNVKLLPHSDKPAVTIGITITTSPRELSLSSTEPFHIVVTARILSTPKPEAPIAIWKHLSPLDALNTRAFKNITSVATPTKNISIYPTNWPHYVWDSENIRTGPWTDTFVEIPAKGGGVLEIKHELPRAKIDAAMLQAGETYQISLTDKCMGTKWWTYGSLDELSDTRIRYHRDEKDEKVLDEYDAELAQELGPQETRRAQYGDGPVSSGEPASMLAMVDEVGPVLFKVV